MNLTSLDNNKVLQLDRTKLEFLNKKRPLPIKKESNLVNSCYQDKSIYDIRPHYKGFYNNSLFSNINFSKITVNDIYYDINISLKNILLKIKNKKKIFNKIESGYKQDENFSLLYSKINNYKNKKYTKKELNKILNIIKSCNYDLKSASNLFPEYSLEELMYLNNTYYYRNINKKNFSPEEDDKLLDLIGTHGLDFNVIVKFFNNRSVSELKKRYIKIKNLSSLIPFNNLDNMTNKNDFEINISNDNKMDNKYSKTLKSLNLNDCKSLDSHELNEDIDSSIGSYIVDKLNNDYKSNDNDSLKNKFNIPNSNNNNNSNKMEENIIFNFNFNDVNKIKNNLNKKNNKINFKTTSSNNLDQNSPSTSYSKNSEASLLAKLNQAYSNIFNVSNEYTVKFLDLIRENSEKNKNNNDNVNKLKSQLIASSKPIINKIDSEISKISFEFFKNLTSNHDVSNEDIANKSYMLENMFNLLNNKISIIKAII